MASIDHRQAQLWARRLGTVALAPALAGCGMGILPTSIETQVQARVDKAAIQADEASQQAQLELKQAQAAAAAGLETATTQAAELGGAAAQQLDQAQAQLAEVGKTAGRAAASLQDATQYQPIDGAKEAIECQDEHCTVRSSFVAAVKREPGRLAADFVVTPALAGMTASSWRGVSLFVVREGSIPALLGLRAGDVITKIGDVQVDGPSKLTSLGRSLRDKKQIAVDYLRSDRQRTLELSVIQ